MADDRPCMTGSRPSSHERHHVGRRLACGLGLVGVLFALMMIAACGKSAPTDGFVGTWRMWYDSRLTMVITSSANGYRLTEVESHTAAAVGTLKRDGNVLKGRVTAVPYGPTESATIILTVDGGLRFDKDDETETEWSRLSNSTAAPSPSPLWTPQPVKPRHPPRLAWSAIASFPRRDGHVPYVATPAFTTTGGVIRVVCRVHWGVTVIVGIVPATARPPIPYKQIAWIDSQSTATSSVSKAGWFTFDAWTSRAVRSGRYKLAIYAPDCSFSVKVLVGR